MKILGINGSPRKNSITGQMVSEILDATGAETELINLAGKRISPCIACLGCVNDNICKVKDDMYDIREKIVAADAYVIGGANYYGMVNSLTHAFLERFYQFFHLDCRDIAGKKAIVVGVAAGDGQPAIDNIRQLLEYNRVEVIGSVSASGPAPCFTCGHGEECKVGVVHRFFGEGTKITPEIIPTVEKQQDVITKARELAQMLAV
ncbi:MAG: flavodoxin family protein [Sedimentisphaeraceae bacterium JB056]